MRRSLVIKTLLVIILIFAISLSFIVKVGADGTTGPAVEIIDANNNKVTISKERWYNRIRWKNWKQECFWKESKTLLYTSRTKIR